MAEPASLEFEITEFELNAAGELLSDADSSTRETKKYAIPIEDDELFGDCTRTSGHFTLPVALDELPDDAYPTEIYFLGVDV